MKHPALSLRTWSREDYDCDRGIIVAEVSTYILYLITHPLAVESFHLRTRPVGNPRVPSTGVDRRKAFKQRLVIRGGTACYWECLKQSARSQAPVEAGSCVLFEENALQLANGCTESALPWLRNDSRFRPRIHSLTFSAVVPTSDCVQALALRQGDTVTYMPG